LWKVDPQNASLYEDALAVYDQEITARGDREKTATSVKVEGPVGQSIEIFPHLDVSIQTLDPASTHGEGPTGTPMSADTEAALTLSSFRYSGHVHEYIHDDTHHTTSLHPFNSKSVAKADLPKLSEADAVSKTEAHELTAGKAVQKCASPQGRATKVSDEDDFEQPRGGLSTRAKKLRSESRPSPVHRSQTLAEPPAPVQSARKPRSSIKAPTKSMTPQPSRKLRSSKRPLTGMAKVSPTISSKARQPEYLGSSPVSRKRRHEEVEDDEEVPVRRKTQVVRYIESEDEATTPLTSTNNSRAGSKQKRAGEKSQRQLINPPADLPLRAPARTPGIPSDALGMDEFFQKNTPCALGVQLPINAARTQWEWVAYVPRKARNARFDWADEENIRDANRWRQQRLRRRLAQHGLIDDGRKRR
jgi:hypothetical protein